MKLVVLGSTGYHPNELRQTACLMLPELGVVLDAGTGMFRVRDWLVTPRLDIFLTHAHLDHVFGLTFLFDVLAGHEGTMVTVHGEADKLAAIEEHLFSPLLFPVKPPCTFEPLAESFALSDGGRLTHFPLEHPGGTVGFRLDWPNRSLAYVTDTTARPGAAYLDAIRNVDVLLHECYFPDSEQPMADLTGHSHTTPVAELAREANVGRLVLLHIYPQSNEEDPIGLAAAQCVFPKTEIAHDRMEIEF
jgi:ribonuclease BN (tRNA processing enzyme)